MSEKSFSEQLAAAVTKAVTEELAKWDLSQVKPNEEFVGNAPENTDETMFAPATVRQVGAATGNVVEKKPSGAGSGSETAPEDEKKPESKPKPEPGSIDALLEGMI